jgi:putative holliday junction resolvase
MNILSLDFGLERIGYAVGSTETGIAFPRKNFKNNHTLFPELKQTLEDEKIVKVIIGNPKKSNPYQKSILSYIELFIDEFEEQFSNIPISFFDERYSSKTAQQKLHQAGWNAKEQKEKVDAVSAQIILQDYLDNQQ